MKCIRYILWAQMRIFWFVPQCKLVKCLALFSCNYVRPSVRIDIRFLCSVQGSDKSLIAESLLKLWMHDGRR